MQEELLWKKKIKEGPRGEQEQGNFAVGILDEELRSRQCGKVGIRGIRAEGEKEGSERESRRVCGGTAGGGDRTVIHWRVCFLTKMHHGGYLRPEPDLRGSGQGPGVGPVTKGGRTVGAKCVE